MHSLIIINRLLYITSIIIRSLIAIALLYNNIIDIASNGLPNTNMLLTILASVAKGL
jgi:hypothetical protein